MGLRIDLDAPRSYREEVITALAGPLMNLLYLLAVPLLPTAPAEKVFAVSLFLAVLNLLPIGDFDGARILGGCVASLFGPSARERVLSCTTALSLTLLWILSLYILFYSGLNLTLLLFCSYLFSYLILKKSEKGLRDGEKCDKLIG